MQDKFQEHEQRLEAADAANEFHPFHLEKNSYHRAPNCPEQVRYVLEWDNHPDQRTALADCLLDREVRQFTVLHAEGL